MSTPQTLEEQAQQVREAARQLPCLKPQDRDSALKSFAALLRSQSAQILAANQADIRENSGLEPALMQRLKLDQAKLEALAIGAEQLASFPDPLGRILERMQLAPGLIRSKVQVPLGVVAVIFESRPDVLPQILSLMLRSGNAVIFKGGSESAHTTAAFMQLLVELRAQLPALPSSWALALHSRAQVAELLRLDSMIDLVIPRGSNQLVRSIMQQTKIPVLGHADGICHTYLHPGADLEQALAVIIDAKTDYPAACNATETLLVERTLARSFLPRLADQLEAHGCRIRGCKETCKILPMAEQVSDDQWSHEYSNLTLAIKIVDGLEQAVAHINRYGSKHTDAILCGATDSAAQEYFTRMVDSAGVYINCSTRFADGYVYGYGAEVGISTSKIHARGPAGIDALLTTKDLLVGSGALPHVRAEYRGPNAKSFSHRALPSE